MARRQDRSLGVGVYFEQEAYAGCVRRLIIFVFDWLFVVVCGAFLWAALSVVFASPAPAFGISYPAIIWAYFAILQPSRIGSLGFLLTDVKIVDLRGNRPSILRMTLRMLLVLLGPFRPFADVFWVGPDTDSRSLRDCYAGTYVVRRRAEPIGKGPLHLSYYDACGFTLMYPHVVRQCNEIDCATRFHQN